MISRLVLGCGGTCLGLLEHLRDRQGSLQVVESDEGRVEQLRNEKIDAHVGDPTNAETLSGLDLDPDVVVIAGDDPDANLSVAAAARETFTRAHLLGYAGEDASRSTARDLEAIVDDRFDPGAALVDHLASVLRRDQADRLRRLRATLQSIDGHLGIFMHDNPDPDAIASAIALAEVADWHGVEATPVYFGSISHQENRAFVNLLELDLENLDAEEDHDFDAVALVDHSSPGVNDQLSPDTNVAIVVDHHPPKQSVDATFVDIREDVGATSTLLAGYLRGYGIEIDVAVATGLLYGIRVDTKDFAREITRQDFEAAAALLPHADVATLQRIESPSIGTDTMETIGRAIRNRRQRGAVLASCVGALTDRDALAQAADRLLNMNGVAVTLVYGYADSTIYLSARARGVHVDLGDALRRSFRGMGSAGGHADMAGAQIDLGIFGEVDSEEELTKMVEDVVTSKFFDVVDPDDLDA
ncbi:MAG: DHH family phosphoesterase [Halanaeroarchaeum sp.]